MRKFKISNNGRIILIGIVLSVIFWILEASIHSFVFQEGNFIRQIIVPNIHEIWMRSLVVCVLILFSIYAQFIITRRQNAERLVKIAYAELDQVFNTAADGMRLIDKEYNVIKANNTFSMLSGVSKNELIGKKCYEVFYGPFCHTLDCSLARIMNGAEKLEIDVEKERKDGVKIHCILTVTPFRKANGEIVGIVEDFKDISERQHFQEELQANVMKLKRSIEGTINAMAMVVETIDSYTAGHQRRVANLSSTIAKELNLSEDQIRGIYVASLIHDIGKIGVPIEILNKPANLTKSEFEFIKKHAKLGYDILKTIEFPWAIAEIVLQHHERLDGSGYPNGLIGDTILLEARILAVADTVEALAAQRPYRPAQEKNMIIAMLLQHKGIRYDEKVVDACLKIIHEQGFEFD